MGRFRAFRVRDDCLSRRGTPAIGRRRHRTVGGKPERHVRPAAITDRRCRRAGPVGPAVVPVPHREMLPTDGRIRDRTHSGRSCSSQRKIEKRRSTHGYRCRARIDPDGHFPPGRFRSIPTPVNLAVNGITGKMSRAGDVWDGSAMAPGQRFRASQAPLRCDDLTQASTKATPSTPSFKPGNVTAGSGARPSRRAMMARAASA